MLAVAAACTLAGAKTFAEIGDQAADLPHKVPRDLGGKPHPRRRKVIAPSQTPIRTLLHLTGTEIPDEMTGGWLRDLADAGRPDGPLTAIAIDGTWLRGVPDGQVKPGAGHRGWQSAEFVTAQRSRVGCRLVGRRAGPAPELGSGPVAACCGPWTAPALRLEEKVIARYPSGSIHAQRSGSGPERRRWDGRH